MRHFFSMLALLFTTIPAFPSELPNTIVGIWQIVEVRLNTESARTSYYAWNDPRLVGRFFTFTTKEIANDTPDDSECTNPSVAVITVPLQDLVTKSMGGNATATDYRLDSEKNGVAEGMFVYCGRKLWNEDLGLDNGLRGSWIYLADADRILLRWRDETILVLQRLPGNQKPAPSFECSKFNTRTESVICSSVDLSAFDRSVSRAYKLALSECRMAGNDSRSLTLDQKLWLRKRNECGANRDCIASSMRKRLNELSRLYQ